MDELNLGNNLPGHGAVLAHGTAMDDGDSPWRDDGTPTEEIGGGEAG